MTDAFGWRSIFLINLPVALIVLSGLALLVPNRKPDRKPRIDLAGAILLAATVTAVVLWSDAGELFGSMLAPRALLVIGAGAICAIAWVFVERRAPEPIIPLPLLKNPTVALLIIVSLTSGGIALGMVNYFALFLQTVHGLAPAKAGLFFIPVTLGIVFGSITTGRLIAAKGYYKRYSVISLCLSGTAFILLSLFAATLPLWMMAVLMALQGLGIGFGQQVPVLGVQNAARGGDIGAATGTVTLARMIGAAAAISIYGAILASGLDRAGTIAGAGRLSDLTPTALGALSGAAHDAAIAGYAATFVNLYAFSALLAVIGLVAAAMLKPVRMGDRPTRPAPASAAGGRAVLARRS